MSKLKQLSGLDASFIYLDTDRASTGGTMIYVYDQSTIPGGGHLRFKEILKHIESRTATSPIFRQKLKQVPMSLCSGQQKPDAFFSEFSYSTGDRSPAAV